MNIFTQPFPDMAAAAAALGSFMQPAAQAAAAVQTQEVPVQGTPEQDVPVQTEQTPVTQPAASTLDPRVVHDLTAFMTQKNVEENLPKTEAQKPVVNNTKDLMAQKSQTQDTKTSNVYDQQLVKYVPKETEAKAAEAPKYNYVIDLGKLKGGKKTKGVELRIKSDADKKSKKANSVKDKKIKKKEHHHGHHGHSKKSGHKHK